MISPLVSSISNRMTLLPLSLFLCLALHTSALAGGGVTCASKDGRAEISIGLGRLPIYAPTSASARLDSKRWASVPQDGELELGASQGMIEENSFSADFVGSDIMKIIISLRIDLSEEEKEGGSPGTLTFEDAVVHRVICQFE